MKVFNAILPSVKKEQIFYVPLEAQSQKQIYQSIERDRLHSNVCHSRILRMKESYKSLLDLSLKATAEEKLLRKQLSHVNAAEKRILELRISEEADKAKRLFIEANTIFVELQQASKRIQSIDQDLASKQKVYSSLKQQQGANNSWQKKIA